MSPHYGNNAGVLRGQHLHCYNHKRKDVEGRKEGRKEGREEEKHVSSFPLSKPKHPCAPGGGDSVGDSVGDAVGDAEGTGVGTGVGGDGVGGTGVGDPEGTDVGTGVGGTGVGGDGVGGLSLGTGVGDSVGTAVGDAVGAEGAGEGKEDNSGCHRTTATTRAYCVANTSIVITTNGRMWKEGRKEGRKTRFQFPPFETQAPGLIHEGGREHIREEVRARWREGDR